MKDKQLGSDKVNNLKNYHTKQKSQIRDIFINHPNDNFTVDKMEVFADILKAYPEVYLKINNFQPNKDHAVACKSKEKEELRSIIQDFLDNHLEWKGRITLVENAAAIEDVEKVGVY